MGLLRAAMKHHLTIAAVLLPVLAACAHYEPAVAPPPAAAAGYERGALPAAIAPAAPGAPAQRLASGADVPARWWEAYGSPQLNALVERAVAASPDLESARAALRSAHELYLTQHGALLPTVDAGYNVTRQKTSQDISPVLNTNADVFTLHTVGVNVGYTPDLFGGLHRQAEGALAQEQALRFSAEAAYLTLTANVAAAAIQQAALRAQIEDAEALVASDRRTLQILSKSLARGELAGPDVAAQEVAVAQAEQALPPLRRQLAQQNDLIAFLIGRTPGDGDAPTLDLASLTLPAELPVSLPSDLVRHRPDVRAAEANVQAAGAAVGVAMAARLPAFALTAGVGGQATDLGSVLTSGNSLWALTGAVTQPIFQGGQLRHRQRSAEALLDQAKAQYRAAVLTAFQNVADSLQALRGDALALDAAAAVDRSTTRALDLAQKQLGRGETSALEALVAEQARLQAQTALTQAKAARLADSAALFQALGGGWWNRTDFADASSAPARP